MKLGELLEEIKIGKESFNYLRTTEQLKEHFNEEINDYKISDLLNLHLQNMLNEEFDNDITNNIRYSIIKIQSIEEKQEKTSLTESFARMKYDSIKNNYNAIINHIEKQKSINEEVLANVLALMKYKLSELAEISKVSLHLQECKIDEKIEKEYVIIEETI